MFKTSLLALMLIVVFCAGIAAAQDSGARTAALVQALDKTKHKKKEKKNISIEIYIDIKNEAAVKSPAEYAGAYQNGDQDSRLELQVSSGSVAGSGRDILNFNGGVPMNFTLRDARIDGALLTATKVYENGQTVPFEAVFVNRVTSTGKNPNEIESRDSMFGIGFILESAASGMTNRVFLERR